MKIRLNNSADAKAVVSIANKFKDCCILRLDSATFSEIQST